LPVSLELMLLAHWVRLPSAFPLQLACAVRSGGAFDRFMTGTPSACFRADVLPLSS